MLTVHHLSKSQSERIIWLCEELGIAYELKLYTRDPVTRLAPPAFKALHPIGSAPVITDGDLILAESGAIIEYIVAKYAPGRLIPGVRQPNFPDYLYWFHFGNGTLQPAIGRTMILRRLNLADSDSTMVAMQSRLDRALGLVATRLGQVSYLAGDELTAADIMIVFSLTTMRLFLPIDLSPYPNIRAYLHRIGTRKPYQRAMSKGDPDFAPLLT